MVLDYADDGTVSASVKLQELFGLAESPTIGAARVQLMAARLYQGQTTNFRTEGGGFAPIYVL